MFLLALFLGFLINPLASLEPYFASLRAKRTHLHVGPGNDYPVEWTYVTPFFPIQVIAAFDTWRQIRDPSGTTGWVHKSLLSSKRSILVIGGKQDLRLHPKKDAPLVAVLAPGITGRHLACQGGFCNISVTFHGKTYTGWTLKKGLFGG